jgi:hypothetical protein
MTAYASKPVFWLGRFAKIPRVLVRFDHVTWFVVNANHSVMGAGAKLRVADCITEMHNGMHGHREEHSKQ